MEGTTRTTWLLRDLVTAAQRETQRVLTDALEPLGISPAWAEALIVLAAQGRMSIRELGRQLINETDHPSRLVSRLADAGLVERRPDPTDGRTTQVLLTEAGHDAAQLVAHTIDAYDERLALNVDGQDLDVCVRTLLRLLDQGASSDALHLRYPVEIQGLRARAFSAADPTRSQPDSLAR